MQDFGSGDGSSNLPRGIVIFQSKNFLFEIRNSLIKDGVSPDGLMPAPSTLRRLHSSLINFNSKVLWLYTNRGYKGSREFPSPDIRSFPLPYLMINERGVMEWYG